MFDRILVPVDGSPDAAVALAHAIDIAQKTAGTIHALFVADLKLIEASASCRAPDSYTGHQSDPDLIQIDALRDRYSVRGAAILAHARMHCEDGGVACMPEFVEGAAPNVILERASHVDLVVLGRRGDGARWAGPQLGSVLEAVVRYAPIPVWISQAEMRPVRRILVAFDGSKRAHVALKLALDLSRRMNSSILVVTVDDGEDGRHAAWAMARAVLVERGRPEKPLLVAGHATREILRIARMCGCDLIALGASSRREFVATIFGSTADEVLHLAIGSVLIAR